VEKTAVLVEEVEKRRALLFGPLKGPNLTQFHRDRRLQQVVDAVNAVVPTVWMAAELRNKFKDLKRRTKHRVNAIKREG
jgi:vacuolar-type H+-ATPase subunit D/Vma8